MEADYIALQNDPNSPINRDYKDVEYYTEVEYCPVCTEYYIDDEQICHNNLNESHNIIIEVCDYCEKEVLTKT